MTLLVLSFLLAAPQQEGLKKALQDLALGKGDLPKLTVTWDDLHVFHGGLRLAIRGDGTVTQTVLRRKAGEAKKKVDAKDLKGLVELLIRHEAWLQRVPERAAVPDESRADLTISVGENSITVWEWYNDLDKNKRLVDIRDLMKKIAWK